MNKSFSPYSDPALELSRQLVISYNATWQIKHKRSFVVAVSMNEEGHPIKMRFSVVYAFKAKEITAWASRHLTPKSLVISDGLACFTSIKEAESFH